MYCIDYKLKIVMIFLRIEPDSPGFINRRHPYGRREKIRRKETLLLLEITKVKKNDMKRIVYNV